MQTPIPGYGKKRRPQKGAPPAGTPASAAAVRKPYYKLARYVPAIGCYKDGRSYPTWEAARAAAKKPGRYRISAVAGGVRTDGAPFTVV